MNTTDKIIVKHHGREVGKIALTPKGLCAFEYSPQWIAGGFSISPFELPLKEGVFIARPNPFGGGFGIFDDSLPDGWGQLILDRYLQKKGINIRRLSILDRLALVGSTGRGALEFEPDRSVMSDSDFTDFTALALDARKILSSDTYAGSGIDEFQRMGGSPGGARPKIFVKADDSEWLVKFRALHDPEDIGQTEYR
ncbi:MAG: HipA N-terminal domain-containing protein, partial [Muribaculaceae bacterium]|nr:HipA N-terminal domain-containing protein [Muribaculaceae bacterium]